MTQEQAPDVLLNEWMNKSNIWRGKNYLFFKIHFLLGNRAYQIEAENQLPYIFLKHNEKLQLYKEILWGQ